MGANRSCGLDKKQQLYCWGRNDKNQLGGSFLNIFLITPDLPVPNLTDVTAVAAGTSHTCAAGTFNGINGLECWGDNAAGQLGSNGGIGSSSPIHVGITNPTMVTAGYNYTCAVGKVNMQTGLYCWGGNFYQQLGPNATPGGALNFVGLPNVTAIAAGGFHTCAIDNQQKLFCWGRNDLGQLGSTGGGNNPLPTEVALNTVTGVTAHAYHTCAIAAPNQSLYCFGNNTNGQLGSNAVGGGTLNFTGLVNVTAIAAGNFHTCAVGKSGAQTGLYCWGLGISGQLGPNSAPQGGFNFTGLTNVSTLIAGGDNTCV